jgi:hypothetical protein
MALTNGCPSSVQNLPDFIPARSCAAFARGLRLALTSQFTPPISEQLREAVQALIEAAQKEKGLTVTEQRATAEAAAPQKAKTTPKPKAAALRKSCHGQRRPSAT